jgi:hypothetical protein
VCHGIIEYKVDIIGAGSSNALAGESQLLLGYVDTEHTASWPDGLGQPKGGRASSTANIEDALPWLGRGGCQCGLRHLGHQLIDPSLLCHPAPCRFAVPECPLRLGDGLKIAHFLSSPLYGRVNAPGLWSARHSPQISIKYRQQIEEQRMSRVIKMATPKRKPVSLPKTAALTKAQAEHEKWLKAHGIKVTKNTLRT